ncbi:MAG: thymidine kinase [Oligoflexia bacterium]|nr:thymidine kinase [Oligoflexia bacterium]
MAKLYFRFGTVGSAKTLNLLAVAHNYRQQGKRVSILKPRLDSRFGANAVRSRAGLEKEADLLVDPNTVLDPQLFEGLSCILLDEAQFVSAAVIDQLRGITLSMNIPVICYGLRTDFRGQLFPGAQRLFELADTLEEVKTTCAYCNRKAIFNLKHVNGVATVEGPSVDLGAEEKYYPACFSCYAEQLRAAKQPLLLKAVGA